MVLYTHTCIGTVYPLSSTISQSLLKLISIELVMLSNHLILCHTLLLLPLLFPSIRVFPNESGLHIWWPKYWSLSFSISPSDKYSGLISFRIDWFNLLAVSRVFSSTTIWKHLYTRTHIYILLNKFVNMVNTVIDIQWYKNTKKCHQFLRHLKYYRTEKKWGEKLGHILVIEERIIKSDFIMLCDEMYLDPQ